VKLASRGQRDMDTGAELVNDPRLAGSLRSQARAVHLRSLVAALIATAVLLYL
jgi:hypothetical protein